MTAMHVICRAGDQARFDAAAPLSAFPTLDSLETEFARHYFPVTRGARMHDCTFAVIDREQPICLVECDIVDGVLAHNHQGLSIAFSAAATLGQRIAGERAALCRIDQLAADHGVAMVRLSEGEADAALGDAGLAGLARGGTPGIRLFAVADLSVGEAALFASVRKSYKSLINWGRRNLMMRYVNGANPDAALYRAFQEFHTTVSGRSTRPQASWDSAFAWLARGHGELALGFLATGELVAASLFRDATTATNYSAGVYDRTRFDKPLAHWPVFDGMVRAAGRGRRRFELGEVFAAGAVTSKEYQIGHFKKGLTKLLVARREWCWAPAVQQTTGARGAS